jgi:hypothetical protein
MSDWKKNDWLLWRTACRLSSVIASSSLRRLDSTGCQWRRRATTGPVLHNPLTIRS